MPGVLKQARLAALGVAVAGGLAFAAPAQATHAIPLIPHTKCGFPEIPREQAVGNVTLPNAVFKSRTIYTVLTRKQNQLAELFVRVRQSDLDLTSTVNGLFYRETGDGFWATGLGKLRIGGENFLGVADLAFDHDPNACDANSLYLTFWATSSQGSLPFPVVVYVDFDNGPLGDI